MKSSEIPRVCTVPGCRHDHDGGDEPVYLHSRCHPNAKVAVYVIGDEAVVECGVCEAQIARLDLVP